MYITYIYIYYLLTCANAGKSSTEKRRNEKKIEFTLPSDKTGGRVRSIVKLKMKLKRKKKKTFETKQKEKDKSRRMCKVNFVARYD